MSFKEQAEKKYVVRDDGSFDLPWSYEIPCKDGAIYPCGLNGDLAVWTSSQRTARRLAAADLKPLQTGTEFSFRFEAKRLDEVARIAGAKKRKQISPELRAKLAQNLAKARNGVGKSDFQALPPAIEGHFSGLGAHFNGK